jgi:hypothetical protein
MYMYDLTVLTDSFEGSMDGAEPRRVSLFCGSWVTYNGSCISSLCARRGMFAETLGLLTVSLTMISENGWQSAVAG